jgi:hypothetical protein
LAKSIRSVEYFVALAGPRMPIFLPFRSFHPLTPASALGHRVHERVGDAAADVGAAAHHERGHRAAAGGALDVEIDAELLVPALDLGEVEPHRARRRRRRQADRDLRELRLCRHVPAGHAGHHHEADGHRDEDETCGGSGELSHDVHLLSELIARMDRTLDQDAGSSRLNQRRTSASMRHTRK